SRVGGIVARQVVVLDQEAEVPQALIQNRLESAIAGRGHRRVREKEINPANIIYPCVQQNALLTDTGDIRIVQGNIKLSRTVSQDVHAYVASRFNGEIGEPHITGPCRACDIHGVGSSSVDRDVVEPGVASVVHVDARTGVGVHGVARAVDVHGAVAGNDDASTGVGVDIERPVVGDVRRVADGVVGDGEGIVGAGVEGHIPTEVDGAAGVRIHEDAFSGVVDITVDAHVTGCLVVHVYGVAGG